MNLDDIQGLVIRGYRMNGTQHLVLRIDDPGAFRSALGRLHVTSAGHWGSAKPRSCLNVGFTARGLAVLGVALDSFPRAFVEGAAGRAEVQVRDVGANAPAHWARSFTSHDAHAVISIFAVGEEALEEAVAELRSRLAGCASEVAAHHAHRLGRSDKEHFGYLDGMSQPTLDGIDLHIGLKDPLPRVPARAVVLSEDPLPPPGISDPMPEIGRNGSFAAFRMMHQDVGAFDAFLEAEASRTDLDPELIAAKICGRWRNGDPLVLRPTADHDEVPHAHRNDFDYEPTDRPGLVCPRGAHIRRAFPRSQRVVDDLTGLHRRIVRRAMPYGPPWKPGERHGIERGLIGYFICASLEHQFEYVMRNWINDGLFTGGRLGRARDPLTGANDPADSQFEAPGEFSATGFPRFVTTRGCLYVFLPSLTALHRLAAVA